MKKYIILFLAVALFASCSDWLDVTPKDKTLEEDLFATEDGIYSANSGLYREMISADLYGRNLSQTTVEVMGHVYTYSPSGREPSNQLGNVRGNWALANFDYEHDRAKGFFSAIWKSGYATLLHINTYIKNLNESPVAMAEKDKEILLGEAYGLRAYLHFDLFRLFGPMWKNKNSSKILPYNNKTAITINHTGYEDAEYSTADEYMALLLKDISMADSLLKNSDPIVYDDNSITNNFKNDNFFQNRNRRMNYYAVKGLEARVRQYRGEYDLAVAAAKVITDKMEEGKRFRWPVIATMVDKTNFIFYREVIFGIDNIEMLSQSKDLYETPSMQDAYVIDAKNLFDNILGYGNNSVEGIIDIRAKQWTMAEITTGLTGIDYSLGGAYRSKKYNEFAYDEDEDTDDYFQAIRDLQVLMRVSEMYYIQAEAALDRGDKQEAARLLNTVLENRALTTQYFMSADKTDMEFQTHIEKEYYREFMGEGQIFFFHKRRGSTKMFKGYEAGTIDIPYPSEDYVVPIPEDETDI